VNGRICGPKLTAKLQPRTPTPDVIHAKGLCNDTSSLLDSLSSPFETLLSSNNQRNHNFPFEIADLHLNFR
jgi:hypothetical protein